MNKNLCILAVLALAGCGGGDPYSMKVTRTEYGPRWPLNVEEARIGCDLGHVAYIAIGDKKYALNGKALSAGLPRPDEVIVPHEGPITADFMERVRPICDMLKGN